MAGSLALLPAREPVGCGASCPGVHGENMGARDRGSPLALVGMGGCGGKNMQTKMFPNSGCLLFLQEPFDMAC